MSEEMGWLDKYTWFIHHKNHSEWDYESCKKEANKYTNQNEFGKHAYGVNTISRLNNWLDDFYPNPLRRVLDYSTCKKLTSKYRSVGELMANDKSLYKSLLKKVGLMSSSLKSKKVTIDVQNSY